QSTLATSAANGTVNAPVCPSIGNLGSWTKNPTVNSTAEAQSYCTQVGCSTVVNPYQPTFNAAYLAAYNKAFSNAVKANTAYQAAYKAAYDAIYAQGAADGRAQGTADGTEDGEAAG